MKIAIVFSACLALAGCATQGPSQRLGYFTAASSFNIRGLEYDQKSAIKVTGEDCVRNGVTTNDSRIQRAMDNAIRSGQESNPDADVLVNVRIDQTYPARIAKDLILPIPVTFNCIEVSGYLVKIKR